MILKGFVFAISSAAAEHQAAACRPLHRYFTSPPLWPGRETEKSYYPCVLSSRGRGLCPLQAALSLVRGFPGVMARCPARHTGSYLMITCLVFKVQGAFVFADSILQHLLLCSVKITEHYGAPWIATRVF